MSPLATDAPLGAPAPGGDRRALRLGASRPNIATGYDSCASSSGALPWRSWYNNACSYECNGYFFCSVEFPRSAKWLVISPRVCASSHPKLMKCQVVTYVCQSA